MDLEEPIPAADEPVQTAEDVDPEIDDLADRMEHANFRTEGEGIRNDLLRRFNVAVRRLREQDPSLSFRAAQKEAARLYHQVNHSL